MELDELLKKITPLPWKFNEREERLIGSNGLKVIVSDLGVGLGSKAQWPDAKSNGDYFLHAANVLPELVDALQELRESHGGCWPWCPFVTSDAGCCNCKGYPISKALARAEEVKDFS